MPVILCEKVALNFCQTEMTSFDHQLICDLQQYTYKSNTLAGAVQVTFLLSATSKITLFVS